MGNKNPKILIVDKDDKWSDGARSFLQNQFYDVDISTNGKDAQLNIYSNDYICVVLNYETKDHPALQVIKYIKLNKTALKIVTIVNNPDILKEDEISEEDIVKLGVSSVLQKSDNFKKLQNAIESFQNFSDIIKNAAKEGKSDEEEMDLDDTQFTKVKISEFYSSQAVLFDVYVRIKADHYIKILHAGDALDQSRIDKYKKKNVEYLYFSNTDRLRYIRFTNYLASKMIKSDKIDTTTKVNITKNVIEKIVEETYVSDLNPQLLQQSHEVTQNIQTFIEGEKDLYKFIRDYQEMDPNAYTHSFLTSLYSCIIAKQFEWESQVTLETLSMASMLHDLGKSKLRDKIIKTPIKEMLPDQLEEYRKHSAMGAEIVAKQRKISPTVSQIILQHHEMCDGSGFPYGLKKSKLSSLTRVVSFANEFVNFIQEEAITPTDGLKKFLAKEDALMKFDNIIIEKFCLAFIDPSKLPSLDKKVE